MVLVPLTEPMYTLLVAGAVRAGIALGRRQMLVAAAVACAAFLAAGQYVRATAVSLLIPLALLPVAGRLVASADACSGRRSSAGSSSSSCSRSWPTTCARTATCRSRPPPTGLEPLRRREPRVRRTWNAEDAARLAEFPGRTWWDREPIRGQTGAGRILEDPAGSLALLPPSSPRCGAASRTPLVRVHGGSVITRDVRSAGW